MPKTVRIELTLKFLIYVVIVAVGLLIGWELRNTVISVGIMLFIAFILNAGLRPAISGIETLSLKRILILPAVWVGKLTFTVARVFGEEREAKQTLFTAKHDIRDKWNAAAQKYLIVRLINNVISARIPRGIAIFVMYLMIFTVIFAVFFLLTNEVVRQVAGLLQDLPGIVRRIIELIDQTFPFLGNILPLDILQSELGQFVNDALQSDFLRGLITGENALSVLSETLGVFSSIAELLVTILTVVIVSVYMLQYKEPVYEGLLGVFNSDRAQKLRELLRKIEAKLGAWLSGQLFLMIIIGVVTYFLVIIPGFFDATYELDDYALPIALVAGLLEALPNIGPAITLVLTAILAVGTSGLGSVAYVVVVFGLLQQLEGIFIVPQVMKRAVGVDPIFSILGVIAGFQIGGVAGAVLAIPIIGILQIVISEVIRVYKGANGE